MAIVDTINSMYENVGEVYDTITNVDLPTNKNIENIPSTIRKSYLDIMNNGIDTIYDNWEKVSGTGTSISLNNTEEAPMTIEYKGNTSMLPKGYTQVEYIESTGTQYIDTGVNADSKMSIDIDYQFTLQGTASYENCFGVINGSGQYLRYHFETRTADSLSFSYYHNNVINTYEGFYTDRVRTFVDMNNLRMRTWKNGTSQLDTNLQDFGDWDSELNFWLFRRNSNTTNLQYFSKNRVYYCKMYAGSVLVRFFIPCYRNSDNAIGLYDIVNNQFYANQGTGTFVKGNDVTPSTSGLSIPTPTYPQDIHIVSGDNYINVVGKNKYNATRSSATTNAVTYSGDTSKIYINGTPNNTGRIFFNKTYLEAGTYTFSATLSKGSFTNGGNNLTYLYLYKGTETTASWDFVTRILLTATIGNVVSATFTISEGSYYYLAWYLDTSYTWTNAEIKYQVESGSSFTSFEPYQSASYEINLGEIELCKIGTYQDRIFKSSGKNLLHEDEYITSRTINGITFTNNGDGTFNITGTATANTSINILYGEKQIELKSGKTYYLYSSKQYDSQTFNMSIPFAQDGTQKYLTANNSITTSGVISNIKLAFYTNGGNTINATNVRLMLVEGDTPGEYEPYGKDWYLNKQIGKFTYNNEGSFTTPATNYYNINGLGNQGWITTIQTQTYISTEYPPISVLNTDSMFREATANMDYAFGIHPNGTGIRFKDSRGLSGADFKTDLIGTEIYFALATPTYEKITGELLNQLEAIKKSYENQTNINQENNDLPFELEVGALKKY